MNRDSEDSEFTLDLTFEKGDFSQLWATVSALFLSLARRYRHKRSEAIDHYMDHDVPSNQVMVPIYMSGMQGVWREVDTSSDSTGSSMPALYQPLRDGLRLLSHFELPSHTTEE